MAERRMFTKKITESDAFLDMPSSTQALYFHLSMNADDDGFINSPKSIQRTVGASNDDMKLLLAKKFIIAFESGVIVIKHWKMHNYLQSDRYKPTDYQEEKAQLALDEKKAYTLANEAMYTECIQNVSIGKDRIGKDRIGNNKSAKAPLFDDPDLEKAFDDFRVMRKKIKAPLTERAEELAVKKLMDLSKGDKATAIAIINQSILSSWKGLFPLDQKKAPAKENKFNQMMHSDYNIDEIERTLLANGNA